MSNQLGNYEVTRRLQDINDDNALDELLVQFRNEARDINAITENTLPLEILNRFNLIHHTLSMLQDDLVKRSIDKLNGKVNN